MSNNWQIKDGKLYCEYKFKDYDQALKFVNQISVLAQKENHHPDISFGWGYVKVSLFSHDQSKVTDRDHRLADQISSLSVPL